jgi:hypothetical protein
VDGTFRTLKESQQELRASDVLNHCRSEAVLYRIGAVKEKLRQEE